MLFKKDEHFTLVVYDSEKTSKSFKINKILLNRFFVGLIILVTLLTVFSATLLYIIQTKSWKEENIFEKQKIYVKEREDLLARLKLLTDENTILQARLAQSPIIPPTPGVITTSAPTPTPTKIAEATITPAPAPSQTPYLAVNANMPWAGFGDFFNFIKRPIGFRNLVAEELINIDNIQLKPNPLQTQLTFDLINNGSEAKITGYVIVLMKNNNNIEAYPGSRQITPTQKIPYNIGEQFGFSRMRPVFAQFKTKTLGKTGFIILVFTRAGDLIYSKEVGPYDVK